MKPSLIFDLDGTLWNAVDQITEAWSIVGKKYFGESFELSPSFVQGLMGKTMDEIKMSLAPLGTDPDILSSFGDECFHYENIYLSSHPGTLFENEIKILSMLAADYDLYIVSNCQAGYIECFLPLCPDGMFVDHMCWDDTRKEKQFTIRALMDRHNIDRAIYIGDTEKDEKASRAAGVAFIHAAYGFGTACEPDGTASTFSSLVDIINSVAAHLD